MKKVAILLLLIITINAQEKDVLKSKYGLRDFDEPPFENIKKEKSFTKIPALLKSSIANSNPEFVSASTDSVNEDSAYVFNILTNDPDANSVTVSVASNPSWLSLTAKSGGTINNITLKWPTPLESGAKATETLIGSPAGIAFDSGGNLYFSDHVKSTIYKIDTNGGISIFAGTGEQSGNHGTISGETYEEGTSVEIVASPITAYNFIEWKACGQLSSFSSPISFTYRSEL